jgi:hypothetical protein
VSDETMTPYQTGVCPACEQPVQFAECDISVPPGAYVETIRGRWICRTAGCRYGEPDTRLTSLHKDRG